MNKSTLKCLTWASKGEDFLFACFKRSFIQGCNLSKNAYSVMSQFIMSGPIFNCLSAYPASNFDLIKSNSGPDVLNK